MEERCATYRASLTREPAAGGVGLGARARGLAVGGAREGVVLLVVGVEEAVGVLEGVEGVLAVAAREGALVGGAREAADLHAAGVALVELVGE